MPMEWLSLLDLVQLDFPEAVIAGGALRDWYHDKPVKDIDIFVSADRGSSGVAKLLLEHSLNDDMFAWDTVISEEFANYSECLDGVVWAIERRAAAEMPPIQVIALEGTVTPQNALERIDFGLCRIAHDGAQLIVTSEFQRDSEKKFFSLYRNGTKPQLLRSLKRYLRLKEKYPDHQLTMLCDQWDVACELFEEGLIHDFRNPADFTSLIVDEWRL